MEIISNCLKNINEDVYVKLVQSNTDISDFLTHIQNTYPQVTPDEINSNIDETTSVDLVSGTAM